MAVIRSEAKAFGMKTTPNSTPSPSHPSHGHEDFMICFYKSSLLFDEQLSLNGKRMCTTICCLQEACP